MWPQFSQINRPFEKNGHNAELVIDHTIGAASLFLGHGLTRGG
jgi:hypothetical protein